MSKEMRKHIDTFKERILNESIFSNKFLIIYQIINYKAIANLDYMNRYKGEEKISEWKSPIYSYIIKANSKDDARNKFESKWGELANYRPKPKLEIISVEEIGDISDKIHTY
jgi:hypothetical protein